MQPHALSSPMISRELPQWHLGDWLRHHLQQGGTLADHKFLFLGAGEAGTCIAEMIALEVSRRVMKIPMKTRGGPYDPLNCSHQGKATVEKARRAISLVDAKGLVAKSRYESLQENITPDAPGHPPAQDVLSAMKSSWFWTTSVLEHHGHVKSREWQPSNGAMDRMQGGTTETAGSKHGVQCAGRPNQRISDAFYNQPDEDTVLSFLSAAEPGAQGDGSCIDREHTEVYLARDLHCTVASLGYTKIMYPNRILVATSVMFFRKLSDIRG